MEGPEWIVITVDGRHRGLSHHQDCLYKQVSVSMVRGINGFYCRLFIVAIRAVRRTCPARSTSDSRINGVLRWKVALIFGRPMMDGGQDGRLVKTEGWSRQKVGQGRQRSRCNGQEWILSSPWVVPPSHQGSKVVSRNQSVHIGLGGRGCNVIVACCYNK